MATTTKASKAAPKKAAATEMKSGAGEAIAEHTKDAKAFGKAAPKAVKAAVAPKAAAAKAAVVKATKPAAPKKAASPSLATRVMRKVKDAAEGAVSIAASAVGKGGSKASAKGK